MYKRCIYAVIIMFICFYSGLYAERTPLNLKARKITERIIIVETDQGSASQLVVASRKGLVVFGSHFSNNAAEEYIRAIKKELGRDDIIYLINDSSRAIKCGGNAVFSAAKIIARENVFDEMKKDQQELNAEIEREIAGWKNKIEVTEKRLKTLEAGSEQAKINLDWLQYCKRLVYDLTHEEYQQVLPELIYKDKISLHLGDISLEINNFGFTLIPEEELLFTANFFNPAHFSNYTKFASEEGIDVPGMLKMLGEVFAGDNQIKTVYSGFAGVMPLTEVLIRIDYLKKLWQEILEAAAKGLSLDETLQALSMDKKFAWVKKWKMYRNAGHAWVNDEHEHNIRLFWNSVGSKSSFPQEKDFPVLKGPYLGQKPPGMTPTVFAPGIVTTDIGETCPAFSPDGKRFVFMRYDAREWDSGIKQYFTLMTEFKNGKWTEPKPIPLNLNKDYLDWDHNFGPDSESFYFTSRRPQSGDGPPVPADIWMIRLTDTGWTEPQKLPFPINTEEFHDANPCFAKNGTLYFTSQREDGYGRSDLYRSELMDGEYREVENLGPAINTEYSEFDLQIAPDESYIVFVSNRPGGHECMGYRNDLYVSFRSRDGSWTEPQNLGEEVNTIGGVALTLTSDAKYLLFTGQGKEPNSDIHWVSTKIIEDLKQKELK